MMKKLILALLASPALLANGVDWKPLFNSRDLDGWSVAVEGAKVGEDPKGLDNSSFTDAEIMKMITTHNRPLFRKPRN